jgi:hypothetical protein
VTFLRRGWPLHASVSILYWKRFWAGLYCEFCHSLNQVSNIFSFPRPPYASFQLVTTDIEICIDLTGRAIFIASWLAAVARRELARFKEFLTWIRAGTLQTSDLLPCLNPCFVETAANAQPDLHNPLRHDILEVNNYLMSGLVVSSIDKWFMGPVPQFNPKELGIVDGNPTLRTTIEEARAAVDETKWQTVCWPAATPNVFRLTCVRLQYRMN